MSGYLDLLFPILFKYILKNPSFFEKGIGNEKEIQGLVSTKFRSISSLSAPASLLDSDTNTFLSPVSSDLPKGTQTAEFQIIGDLSKCRAIVVHLPATGDQGFSLRREKYAKPLYQQHNIGSVLLMASYYAKRKPKGQSGFALQTVEDIARQSYSIVAEAVYIIDSLRKKYPNTPVGVTGVSYGGSMAGLAGLLSPHDIAVSTLVPADRPVFLDGVLRKTLPQSLLKKKEAVLKGIFDKMTFDPNLEVDAKYAKERKKRMSYVQVSADNDGFIPALSSERAYAAMSRAKSNVASSLHRLNGGHASSIW
eukprot:CAMPEP_0167747724 /NCGR_PEP_ID=MMETSP0110_2-20121227/4439_1 /TAXON_ID=629695 /ORGANISM="Gymnochlora sp., Strain CCMP2014" /LENGTH=307 /DNA_ID=CAMNT_0007632655 /DNA_START=322 /DNA_END=1242 /DNA_ORIENTATION=+